jgi:hypothetical protein
MLCDGFATVAAKYMQAEHVHLEPGAQVIIGTWRSLVIDNVMQKLHQMADLAISGRTAWPASPEDSDSVWKMLADSGVTEESSDGRIGYTDPRASADIQLLVAVIGAIHTWDIPFLLEEQGYASEEEAVEVWEAETDAEALRLLKLLIFRAYRIAYRPPAMWWN